MTTPPQEMRINANHQLLRQRLSKRNRKLLLRIIDDKDQICTDVSLDSFICGFRLAWQIANQIQNHDGCSDCSQRAEPDTRQLFSNNEQFRMLSGDYNTEQNSLKERIPQTVERIEKLQSTISNVTRFIDKAKRYTEIYKLTGELLNLFIERIEVGEREERYSRTAEQTIVIHYRDIGVIGAFAEEAQKIAG